MPFFRDRDARIERQIGRVLVKQRRKAEAAGDTVLVSKCDQILEDELMFGMFVEEYRLAAGVDEEPRYYLGVADELIKILNWFIEHGDELIALIEKIIKLFADLFPAGRHD